MPRLGAKLSRMEIPTVLPVAGVFLSVPGWLTRSPANEKLPPRTRLNSLKEADVPRRALDCICGVPHGWRSAAFLAQRAAGAIAGNPQNGDLFLCGRFAVDSGRCRRTGGICGRARMADGRARSCVGGRLLQMDCRAGAAVRCRAGAGTAAGAARMVAKGIRDGAALAAAEPPGKAVGVSGTGANGGPVRRVPLPRVSAG